MSNRHDSERPEIPWFTVIIGFAVFWPVGLGLLVYKLMKEGSENRQRQDWVNALYDFKDDVNIIANDVRENVSEGFERVGDKIRQGQTKDYQYRPSYSSGRGRRNTRTQKQHEGREGREGWVRRGRKIKDGKLFTLIGAILALSCGFVTVQQFLFWFPHYPLIALQDTFPAFVMAGVGAGMFVWGRFKARQAKRFRRLLNLIGGNTRVNIMALSEAVPCSYNRACDMLQNMIDAGYLGQTAYIDMSTGILVLDGKGIEFHEPKPKPEEKKEPKTPEEERRSDQDILEQIRRINESIPDPVISRKIDRIEEITGHILEYQKKHPDKAGELHKFLNYYLPTTLKILNAYAELDRQGVDGSNIHTTKERIERMMDLVVEGFEKQLDKLFEGDMMDISSDISVMEKMLSHDGLAGGIKFPSAHEDGGIHLTLDPDEKASPEPRARTYPPSGEASASGGPSSGQARTVTAPPSGSERTGTPLSGTYTAPGAPFSAEKTPSPASLTLDPDGQQSSFLNQDPFAGIHLTLDPNAGAESRPTPQPSSGSYPASGWTAQPDEAPDPTPDLSWADSFYRRTKEELHQSEEDGSV